VMRTTTVRWTLGHRPALDGLRGLAVALVLADHTAYLREPSGGIGVVVFFVLSGFLITRVIVEARDSGTWSMPGFVANRFVRLFPALLVMVAVVSVGLALQGFTRDQVAGRAVPALVYVENMQPPGFRIFSHTWSLGVEEQFYLLWPLAVPWLLNRRMRRTILVLAIAASCAAMILTARDWLPMHAYALLAGCLLALVGPVVHRWWLVPAGTVALVGALMVAPHLDRIYVYGPMLATPAAVLLVAGAAGGNRVLELRPLRFLGRISYAVYLWHVPVLVFTHTLFGRASAIPAVALALVLGAASTLLLEEPLRRAWRVRRSPVVSRPHALT
jgi:peptidoglycan/LPS O-acetylase OafA/YrhL